LVRNAAGALGLVLFVAGCGGRQWDRCAIAGAVAGAVGGAVVADATVGKNKADRQMLPIAGSALGGMALGAIAGHFLCDPLGQPSPPPPASAAVPPPLATAAVPPPPGPLAKVVVTDEQIVPLEPIYFEVDRATIRPGSFPILDAVAKVMSERTELKVRVEGHTDSTGTAPHNDRLSQRRAEAVVIHLERQGIATDRLEAVGRGSSRPIAPNRHTDGSDDPQGRAKNRRTEFHIVPIPGTPAVSR
jgi:outer membrane protein OmpA-like peptidoglycan-associated protein